MRSHLLKFTAVMVCLFMLIGISPAGAAENTVILTRYGIDTYFSPVATLPTGAVIAGDINGDGETDNKDLTRLFQHLSNWDVEVNRSALDVNGDQSVDNKDLTRLFQFLSNWDVKIFPEPITCEHGGDTEIRDAKEPTCSEEGYTGDTYCLLCGSLIATGEAVPTLPHTGGTATCHTKAVCEVCGAQYGDFDPDNHSGGTEIRNSYPASCVRGGYTGDTYCLGCGEKLGEGEFTEISGTHINTEVVRKVEPTCVASGYTGDTVCSDCGVLLEQGTVISPTGIHVNTEIRDAYPATCMMGGYSGDTYCFDCGMTVAWGNYIEPTGHLHTEIRGEAPATCTTDGHTGDIYCLDCGELVMSGESIPPTGHVNTEIRNATPATCTVGGYTGDTYCVDCGELIMPGTYIEPAGHTGGEATYYSKAVCDNCGEEYGRYAQILAYNSLNETQKAIYRVLDVEICDMNMGWITLTPYVDFGTYNYDINAAFKALGYDRPAYFWMPKVILVSTSYRGNIIAGVKVTFNYVNEEEGWSVGYPISPDDKAWMQRVLGEKLQDAINRVSGLETDFEKEVAIHDYLCELITYDYATANDTSGTGGNPLSFTAYGALANGMAVCEGYSRAMQLICQRLGIPCGLVTGLGNSGKDAATGEDIWGPHMWNIINPGDGCYYLDVTFDDPTGNTGPTSHANFNLTKSNMEKDHTFDDVFVQGEEYWYVDNEGYQVELDFNFFETHGDNTALEYYNATGAYINGDDAASAAEYVIQMCLNGQRQVSVKFYNDSPDSLSKAQRAYAALKSALGNRIGLETGFEYTDSILTVKVYRSNTH